MDKDAVAKADAGRPPEDALARARVLKKLTREVMPAHLRATLEAQEAEKQAGGSNPIPLMPPRVARGLVAFFEREHPNEAWLIVWRDFEMIRRRAREADGAI